MGQDHVVQALRNAIRLNRLAQAYLFCGTRGVGKTSMARIFAKCLNCVQGPTENPCQVCENCQAIESGQDVDVIEIDGASNNGVEQVRELRQNVSLRPSRSRFKIYYIDEVHMLSTGAFNALLKTLEEPPPHVKFFFATTEANKIPITVLSRCQRYDFAGITPDAIVGTLAEICTREKVEAEPEALQVVARRAGGSMRDAQSLLEQLLASGSPRLTVEVVNALLGTPSDERLLEMLEALSDHDSAGALTLLDQAANEGVQPSDLLAGVLDFLRDAMMLSVGAGKVLLAVSPRQRPRLQAIVDHWSTDAILAALQILAEARARMRGVSYGRLLTELAFARIARLENLTDLSNLVERLVSLESGTTLPPKLSASGVKKKLAPVEPPRPAPAIGHAPESEIAPVMEPADAAITTPSDTPVDGVGNAESGPEITVESSLNGDAEVLNLGRRSAAVTIAEPRTVDPGSEKTAPIRPVLAVPAHTVDHGMTEVLSAREVEVRHESAPLELEAVSRLWPDLIKKIGGSLSWRLPQVEPVAIEGSDLLVIAARRGYNSVADACGTDEAREKIAQCIQRLLRKPVRVRYERTAEPSEVLPDPRDETKRPDLLAADPMVQKVIELFEARPMHLEYEDQETLSPPA